MQGRATHDEAPRLLVSSGGDGVHGRVPLKPLSIKNTEANSSCWRTRDVSISATSAAAWAPVYQQLQQCMSVTHVRHLELSDVSFDSQQWSWLCTVLLPAMPTLTELRLAGVGVTDGRLTELLCQPTGLHSCCDTELLLPRFPKVFTAPSTGVSQSSLVSDEDSICNSGGVMTSSLVSPSTIGVPMTVPMRGLQVLDLSNNNITHRGSALIGKFLMCAADTLDELHLSGNPLGDRGFRILSVYLIRLRLSSLRGEPHLFPPKLVQHYSRVIARRRCLKHNARQQCTESSSVSPSQLHNRSFNDVVESVGECQEADDRIHLGISLLNAQNCQASLHGVSVLLSAASQSHRMTTLMLGHNGGEVKRATKELCGDKKIPALVRPLVTSESHLADHGNDQTSLAFTVPNCTSSLETINVSGVPFSLLCTPSKCRDLFGSIFSRCNALKSLNVSQSFNVDSLSSLTLRRILHNKEQPFANSCALLNPRLPINMLEQQHQLCTEISAMEEIVFDDQACVGNILCKLLANAALRAQAGHQLGTAAYRQIKELHLSGTGMTDAGAKDLALAAQTAAATGAFSTLYLLDVSENFFTVRGCMLLLLAFVLLFPAPHSVLATLGLHRCHGIRDDDKEAAASFYKIAQAALLRRRDEQQRQISQGAPSPPPLVIQYGAAGAGVMTISSEEEPVTAMGLSLSFEKRQGSGRAATEGKGLGTSARHTRALFATSESNCFSDGPAKSSPWRATTTAARMLVGSPSMNEVKQSPLALQATPSTPMRHSLLVPDEQVSKMPPFHPTTFKGFDQQLERGNSRDDMGDVKGTSNPGSREQLATCRWCNKSISARRTGVDVHERNRASTWMPVLSSTSLHSGEAAFNHSTRSLYCAYCGSQQRSQALELGCLFASEANKESDALSPKQEAVKSTCHDYDNCDGAKGPVIGRPRSGVPRHTGANTVAGLETLPRAQVPVEQICSCTHKAEPECFPTMVPGLAPCDYNACEEQSTLLSARNGPLISLKSVKNDFLAESTGANIPTGVCATAPEWESDEEECEREVVCGARGQVQGTCVTVGGQHEHHQTVDNSQRVVQDVSPHYRQKRSVTISYHHTPGHVLCRGWRLLHRTDTVGESARISLQRDLLALLQPPEEMRDVALVDAVTLLASTTNMRDSTNNLSGSDTENTDTAATKFVIISNERRSVLSERLHQRAGAGDGSDAFPRFAETMRLAGDDMVEVTRALLRAAHGRCPAGFCGATAESLVHVRHGKEDRLLEEFNALLASACDGKGSAEGDCQPLITNGVEVFPTRKQCDLPQGRHSAGEVDKVEADASQEDAQGDPVPMSVEGFGAFSSASSSMIVVNKANNPSLPIVSGTAIDQPGDELDGGNRLRGNALLCSPRSMKGMNTHVFTFSHCEGGILCGGWQLLRRSDEVGALARKALEVDILFFLRATLNGCSSTSNRTNDRLSRTTSGAVAFVNSAWFSTEGSSCCMQLYVQTNAQCTVVSHMLLEQQKEEEAIVFPRFTKLLSGDPLYNTIDVIKAYLELSDTPETVRALVASGYHTVGAFVHCHHGNEEALLRHIGQSRMTTVENIVRPILSRLVLYRCVDKTSGCYESAGSCLVFNVKTEALPTESPSVGTTKSSGNRKQAKFEGVERQSEAKPTGTVALQRGQLAAATSHREGGHSPPPPPSPLSISGPEARIEPCLHNLKEDEHSDQLTVCTHTESEVTSDTLEFAFTEKLRRLHCLAYSAIAHGALLLDRRQRHKMRICKGKWGCLSVTVAVEWDVFLVVYFVRRTTFGVTTEKLIALVHPIARGVHCFVDMGSGNHGGGKSTGIDLIIEVDRLFMPDELDIDSSELEHQLQYHVLAGGKRWISSAETVNSLISSENNGSNVNCNASSLSVFGDTGNCEPSLFSSLTFMPSAAQLLKRHVIIRVTLESEAKARKTATAIQEAGERAARMIRETIIEQRRQTMARLTGLRAT
ncbi:hypothetical protein TRVL_03071 [Trypanosoma vivax]|nr:hypothetical protein TRVL_03071 [Trypanosoma vivax]